MLVPESIKKLTGRQRMIEDLTRKITARCEAGVWARVKALATQMDPAQARGYIRARSALVLNRELAAAIDGLDDITDSIRSQVKQLSLEALVRQTMAVISKRHPTELRRAA